MNHFLTLKRICNEWQLYYESRKCKFKNDINLSWCTPKGSVHIYYVWRLEGIQDWPILFYGKETAGKSGLSQGFGPNIPSFLGSLPVVLLLLSATSCPRTVRPEQCGEKVMRATMGAGPLHYCLWVKQCWIKIKNIYLYIYIYIY